MKLSFNLILNNITFSDKYPNEILNEINNFILGTKIELGTFGSNVNQIVGIGEARIGTTFKIA